MGHDAGDPSRGGAVAQVMADCAACQIADRDPYSRLVSRHCRDCRVRRTAQLPLHQRESVYASLPAPELAAFVADVWAEIARQRMAAREQVLHIETVWAHAGGEP